MQILHISPNHQFPTGTVTPILRRQALLRWAEEQRGYIIEDDYDSEFRFTGRPIPAMKSIDAAGRVIYMNTFSRSLAPSLRVSYMVLPPSLMEEYPRRLGFYSCTVPAMEQYTLASFLEEGYFESHVNRMRVFYRNRRDEVLAAIGQSPLVRPLPCAWRGGRTPFFAGAGDGKGGQLVVEGDGGARSKALLSHGLPAAAGGGPPPHSGSQLSGNSARTAGSCPGASGWPAGLTERQLCIRMQGQR